LDEKISCSAIYELLFCWAVATAATLTVEKRTPNGGSLLGPFALTVTCTDSSVFSFSLQGGESSSFVFPDGNPIDCSITETMTLEQANAYVSTVGDTYGVDDGNISALDAISVSGQTFFVTNTIKWWGKPSSITASSITPQNSSTENSTPITKPVIFATDPYVCGAWFVGQITSEDITKTTVTIDLQKQGKSVKLFTPVLNAQWVYSQPLNYSDPWSSTYVATGNYSVIVTASYLWTETSITFSTEITNQCDQKDYLDMLKERNKSIINAQHNETNETPAVQQPVAPKKLPNTGAEVL
jgi:hypothetical protein